MKTTTTELKEKFSKFPTVLNVINDEVMDVNGEAVQKKRYEKRGLIMDGDEAFVLGRAERKLTPLVHGFVVASSEVRASAEEIEEMRGILEYIHSKINEDLPTFEQRDYYLHIWADYAPTIKIAMNKLGLKYK